MTDRIKTVDMSDPAVVLDCYLKLNVAYKQLKTENATLRAALKPLADEVEYVPSRMDDDDWYEMDTIKVGHIRIAAAALKETGDD